jgi:hypothetical protein
MYNNIQELVKDFCRPLFQKTKLISETSTDYFVWPDGTFVEVEEYDFDEYSSFSDDFKRVSIPDKVFEDGYVGEYLKGLGYGS